MLLVASFSCGSRGPVMLENRKIRFSRCKKFKAVKADYGY